MPITPIAGLRAAFAAALAILAAAALTALAGPPAAMAAFPGKPGRIAYTVWFVGDDYSRATASAIGLDYEIVSKRPDGSGQRLLTDNTIHDVSPAWSSSGRRIVFASDRNEAASGQHGDFDLYIMRGDGSEERQLTSLPGPDLDPAFSPNGRTVVFTSCSLCGDVGARNGLAAGTASVDADSGLWLVGSDCLDPHQLTHRRNDSEPTFSPNGRLIAFSRDGDIWVIRPDGTHARRVARGSEATNPDFSPNGRRIVYEDYSSLINTVSLRTGRISSPDLQGDVFDPVYSPDGRYLAFVHSTHSVFDDDINVMNLRGHRRRRDVTRSNVLQAMTPSWQPRPRG